MMAREKLKRTSTPSERRQWALQQRLLDRRYPKETMRACLRVLFKLNKITDHEFDRIDGRIER